jgi:cell division protein FtsB
MAPPARQRHPLVEGQENELTATLRREIAALQARVSRLSEENQGLRAELALLKAGSDQQA